MKLGPFEIPGYVIGDARELLRQLPDDAIDCVVTSPPYWGLRDYGTGRWDGGDDPSCSHSRKMGGTAKSTLHHYKATCARCGARRVDRQLGLEPSPQIYTRAMSAVFREIRRILKPAGTVWVNMGDTYAGGGHGLKAKDLVGLPWRLAFALQDDGWWLRSDIIWHKPNPMPESVTDRPTKAHEYLFLLAKSEEYYYDADSVREPMVAPEASMPDDVARAFSRRRATVPEPHQDAVEPAPVPHPSGRNRRSVWMIATEPTRDAHFATFPRKLVEPCILAGCPPAGVVLDPFGGSGTVGRVAEDLGRKWLLFDLNPAYAEIAQRKTAQRSLLHRVSSGGAG